MSGKVQFCCESTHTCQVSWIIIPAFLDFHFFTPEPSNVDLNHDKFYIIMKLSGEIMRCDLTQMKAIKQYFTMLLDIMLYKVVLSFESVERIFSIGKFK